MEIGQKVKIISDSTCDLSQELTAKYDIDILPLHILLGENEFRDGKDTTPDRIFAWADANKATPKTSAPSLEDAKVLLHPVMGRAVIVFGVGGQAAVFVAVLHSLSQQRGVVLVALTQGAELLHAHRKVVRQQPVVAALEGVAVRGICPAGSGGKLA